jgi:hypothetical protein
VDVNRIHDICCERPGSQLVWLCISERDELRSSCRHLESTIL